MNIEGLNLCIGCMKPLGQTGRCSFCGMKQEEYNPIPRCLLPGTRLADRYILGKVLGEGSFGITYIGWDSRLQIPVAIKEYFPSEMVSRDVICGNGNKVYLYENAKKDHYQEDIKKFLNEAKCLSKFNEVEGIVSVLDFFYENETAYIVMQFIDGVSVKEYIKEKGKMSGRQLLSAMRPVLLALEKVHRTGIVHRDISPDNIMIRKDGSLVLIDFGAARMRNIDNTKTMTVLFKRGFSPEEQYRYKGRWGAYTDVYSISATMYYMLTGNAPTDSVIRALGDDMPSLLNMKDLGISARQKKAIMKGMAVNAKNRWQSIRELYDALYEEEQKTSWGVARRKRTAGIAAAVVAGTVITIGCLNAGIRPNNSEPVAAVETPKVIETLAATETPQKEIRMIDVTGKTKAEAEKECSDVSDIIWKEKYSDEVKKGNVISQNISEGEIVGEDQKLVLTVSRGKKKTAVPKVIGLSLEQAKKKLKKKHFFWKVQKEESDKEDGIVLSQSIREGRKAVHGTTLTLTVSKQKTAVPVATKKPVVTRKPAAATAAPGKKSEKEKKDFVGVIQ